ncbi:MAG: glycosyltransferase [Lachnospiraceae bacterium]|nr:glycosyltransferase [Lachnospiraceae bacterium]
MKILYYTWNENSRDDMLWAWKILGHETVICDVPCRNYEQDEELAASLERAMQKQGTDCIFSFNFFPVVAETARKHKIKYISWIYDCPHWTMYSPAAKSEFNHIFAFDRQQYQELRRLGVPHCYHLPLAVNTTRLKRMLGETGASKNGSEISFVGSLYENNLYDQVQYLPEYVRGYLSGIMEAQERIYGYNLVGELLTDEVIGQMKQYISMEMPPGYSVTKRDLYAAMIDGKITSRERISLLQEVSAKFSLTLYTASDTSGLPQAGLGGIVDYTSQMPKIFRDSKINLNMSLRSITSGIPLRALDVMGAGGFLLSNYQPELAECFEDGKELALYGSAQELIEKAAYYLAHEEERQEIAAAGFRKVQELFSYEVKVKQMLELAGCRL